MLQILWLEILLAKPSILLAISGLDTLPIINTAGQEVSPTCSFRVGSPAGQIVNPADNFRVGNPASKIVDSTGNFSDDNPLGQIVDQANNLRVGITSGPCGKYRVEIHPAKKLILLAILELKIHPTKLSILLAIFRVGNASSN